ncbi:hypothetical protein [Allisonella histaminiformans]|uniref:hypothetical protein n=1 Tax=Allisonella histaminiformans TaxID=209880 RepID=UPI003F89542E
MSRTDQTRIDHANEARRAVSQTLGYAETDENTGALVARDGGPVMSACIEPDACPHDGEIDVETYGCNAWRVCGDCGEILDSAAWWEAGL